MYVRTFILRYFRWLICFNISRVVRRTPPLSDSLCGFLKKWKGTEIWYRGCITGKEISIHSVKLSFSECALKWTKIPWFTTSCSICRTWSCHAWFITGCCSTFDCRSARWTPASLSKPYIDLHKCRYSCIKVCDNIHWRHVHWNCMKLLICSLNKNACEKYDSKLK